MCCCVLYPRSKLFVTSGGKQQASDILSSKVKEICTLIPAFEREIDWRRGKTQEQKDHCKYVFKNGSELDNLAARESTRGQRRHGGAVEECAGVDDKILREVIIPTMAVSRRCLDGSTHKEEPLNKKQVFITTAGYKNTYPYDRLIGFLVRMLMQPDRCIVLGGTWRLPVKVGLQDSTFIQDQKDEGTFNEASFEREFESRWTGDVESAFFNAEAFERNRVLNQPEREHSGRLSKSQYYILSVDVGRKSDNTVVCVIKVSPSLQGASLKQLVYIYSFTAEHFEDQAIFIKKLYYKYQARRIVIDGAGAGVGLVDFLTKPQINLETNETYPDFGVYGGTQENAAAEYKKYRSPLCEQDALYIMKANGPINTEAHTILQTQMGSGKIKFLIDERTAKAKLMGTKVGQNMTSEQRTEYLNPFVLTSILKEELINLREENEGVDIRLKQANKNIKKDKVSALEYGIYYITKEEDNGKKKKRFNAADWAFFN